MTFQIPVRHMFSVRLEELNRHVYDYVGPFGRRRFEKAVGGAVNGAAMKGRVVEHHATDYGRVSTNGAIRALNASIVLESEDGVTILMQYRGRMSPAYDAGQSRLQVLFQAPEGPYGWFNAVQAIGYGRGEGGDVILDVFALTGGEAGEGEAQNVAPDQRTLVPADFLFMRRSAHSTAPKRTIEAPLGLRYLTIAEGGGKFEGPKLRGDFLSGFSWSPHRMQRKGDGFLMQYDVETLLRTDDGSPILMNYTGTASTEVAKHKWMTGVLFETETGSHAWLNEIQAVGFGRWMGDGAEYHVFGLR